MLTTLAYDAEGLHFSAFILYCSDQVGTSSLTLSPYMHCTDSSILSSFGGETEPVLGIVGGMADKAIHV